jgi:hypothetical protein
MNVTAVSSPKGVGRYGNTKSDNAQAHDCPINKAHHTTAQVAAQQCAGCHNSAILPIHLTFEKKDCYSNGSEAPTSSERLERLVIDADSTIDELVVLR